MKEKTIWHMKNMNTKSFMNMMANTAKAHAATTNTHMGTPMSMAIHMNTITAIPMDTATRKSAAAVVDIATTTIQGMTKRIPRRRSSR